ncbi:hypothetical protein GS634_03115 [Ruegeria atlantica]|uniref:Uncharacterized protein n=1 Tax=Ruegeria atlantica TaxID=81569 RepID=A0AA91BYN0_9RHOB|nr:hypothetical protein [Ruegeria atlantica]NOE17109.1 hypothetical protein [Ruegeria atlantica]
MSRRHIVTVVNRSGGLVHGVKFEVQFDGKTAYSIQNSKGMYVVTGIPSCVVSVTVRASDDKHDKTRTFSASDDSYEFLFENAPTAGLTLHSLVSNWIRIRPKILNKIAFFLVFSGVGMASSPWWLPVFYQVFGVVAQDFEPPSAVFSGMVILLGVGLAVIVNWDTIRKSLFDRK